MQMGWRVFETRRFLPARKSELNEVGHLVRQIMEGKRGDQADDGTGNLAGNGDQIGLRQRRPPNQTIQAPPHALDHPLVAKPIEHRRRNPALPDNVRYFSHFQKRQFSD